MVPETRRGETASQPSAALTAEEADLLRTSMRLLTAERSAAAHIFYTRLFDIAPEVRPLFSDDMTRQGMKLMNTLAVVVAQIHDLEPLRPTLEDLARRHVRYGARPAHYEAVGEALLWTVSCFVSQEDGATVEVWRKAFATLSGAMIRASGEPESSPTAVARSRPAAVRQQRKASKSARRAQAS